MERGSEEHLNFVAAEAARLAYKWGDGEDLITYLTAFSLAMIEKGNTPERQVVEQQDDRDDVARRLLDY